MSEATKQLFAAVNALPELEQREFAAALSDSLLLEDEGPELEAELERRWQGYISGERPGIPAEEVYREVRARYNLPPEGDAMSEAYTQALAVVMELPETERRALADAVYQSLPEPPGLSEDDPELNAMLLRRLDDLESGRVVGIPGEAFFNRLREKQAS